MDDLVKGGQGKGPPIDSAYIVCAGLILGSLTGAALVIWWMI